jgi:hypothetical protein
MSESRRPGHVTCTVENGVAQVRLDRPEKLNALTLDLLGELVATATRLRRDRTLRAVVLAGEGDAFCAGRPGSRAPSCPGRCAAPTPSRRRAGRGGGCRSR